VGLQLAMARGSLACTGASRPCAGAAAHAIVPLRPKGTPSLPRESSFTVEIFPCLFYVIPLLELENKQLKEKKE